MNQYIFPLVLNLVYNVIINVVKQTLHLSQIINGQSACSDVSLQINSRQLLGDF